MMTMEEFEERNLQSLIKDGPRDGAFGVSHIQRICKIGYIQACDTRDRAIEQGVLVKDADKEWLVRFVQ